MTTFKEISGQLIKSLSSDPSPAAAGDMWYNSTSQTLKGVVLSGAWASGGNMNTGRSSCRGAGIQTAAFAIGGQTPGPTVGNTENYNGSSWTNSSAFPTGTRNAFAFGTQTAGLAAGGNSSPGQTPYNTASAEYDGSNWTASPGSMSPAKGFGASSGSQTSALATGGDGPGSPFAQSGVQSYNGSTWSSETAYPTTIYGATGGGTSETAAVVFGGEAPYPGNNPGTGDYNGSAWTVVAKNITDAGAPKTRGIQATSASPSSNIGSMGLQGPTNITSYFLWDDTAWTTLPNMAVGGEKGGAGIVTAALAFGGNSTGVPSSTVTEEYTEAAATKTFTTS